MILDPSVLLHPLYILLGLAIIVQLGYMLYYIPALLGHKSQVPDYQPPISVLVCAHNEHDNLVELMPLLLQQEYQKFEVVVINDRSHDESRFYLGSLQQLYANLKVVKVDAHPEGISPKKYALTLGIRAATYEHVLLTDADCRPTGNRWVAAMAGGFYPNFDIVLGYSPYERRKGFLNSLIRFETLLTGWQYLSAAISRHAYMGVGRNMAYTKSTFFRNKGFASHIRKLSGDDDLFVNQASLNSRVGVCLDAEGQTISKPKTTLKEWWVQKRRHLTAGHSYRAGDKQRLGLYILSSILFYILSLIILVLPLRAVWLGIFFAIRTIAVSGLYHAASRKLNDRIPVWLMPLLDAAYFAFYICLGISLLFSRKVRWN